MIHSSELEVVNTAASEVKEVQAFIFDESAFIASTIENLKDLHGTVNSNDIELVKQLAAHTRTFRFTDAYLIGKSMVVVQKSNGVVQHPYINIRHQSSMACAKILQILKLDLATRKHTAAPEEGDSYFDFSPMKKPKAKVPAN